MIGTLKDSDVGVAVFHPLPVEASRLPGRPGTSAQLDEDQFYDHSSLSASPWWTISDFVKMTRWLVGILQEPGEDSLAIGRLLLV